MPCCQPSSYQRITSGTHLKAQVDFSSRCLQHNGEFCTPAEPICDKKVRAWGSSEKIVAAAVQDLPAEVPLIKDGPKGQNFWPHFLKITL